MLPKFSANSCFVQNCVTVKNTVQTFIPSPVARAIRCMLMKPGTEPLQGSSMDRSARGHSLYRLRKGWRTEGSEIELRSAKNFHFYILSRLALGPSLLSYPMFIGPFSPGSRASGS
jgi:hypothetical protein